ncbi:MAG: ATP phosphoribosyltransferase regulatory subunit [Nitrospirota bacterium]|nr:ATP phosphoribosyltransferase regulatory subunit [Nitrospirota bacterium]
MSRATDLARTSLPRGVASFFPEAAEHKRAVEERLWSIFSSWGYREIVPPVFEYLDVLAQGLDQSTVEGGYKVEDRDSGRLMVLRPDVTAQVARMAAARRDDPARPHRYGYIAGVFSHSEAHRGRPREVFQAGVELLGPAGYSADVEVLALLITALRGLGLEHFSIAIGQARFFRAILEGLELSPEAQEHLTAAVARKDAPSIRTQLAAAGIDAERAEQVARIPFLIGGKEVFAAARELTRCADALGALEHLHSVMEALDGCGLGEHLLADLGEVRDLDYYTGVVFDVLVPDMGMELGGGGRYDDLLGGFGHPMPAIGFALDVERVLEALHRCGAAPRDSGPVYTITGQLADAHRAAARLRAMGLTAVAALKSDAGGPDILHAEGDQLFRVGTGGKRTPLDPATLAGSGKPAGQGG